MWPLHKLILLLCTGILPYCTTNFAARSSTCQSEGCCKDCDPGEGNWKLPNGTAHLMRSIGLIGDILHVIPTGYNNSDIYCYWVRVWHGANAKRIDHNICPNTPTFPIARLPNALNETIHISVDLHTSATWKSTCLPKCGPRCDRPCADTRDLELPPSTPAPDKPVKGVLVEVLSGVLTLIVSVIAVVMFVYCWRQRVKQPRHDPDNSVTQEALQKSSSPIPSGFSNNPLVISSAIPPVGRNSRSPVIDFSSSFPPVRPTENWKRIITERNSQSVPDPSSSRPSDDLPLSNRASPTRSIISISSNNLTNMISRWDDENALAHFTREDEHIA